MQTSPLKNSSDQWLLQLNNPQAEHRRDALIALTDSETLDEEIIRELRLIARGDPDAKTRSLARKLLKSRGIKILPQIAQQPGVKETNPLRSLEFWAGFYLFPIFNFIGLILVSLINANIRNLLVVNLVLLVYFGLTRKNVAFGMVVSCVLLVVMLLCYVLYLSQCWPDGCAVPQ